MNCNNQNDQLNETRNNFNNKVSKLNMLGACKSIKWNNHRRFRTL